MIRIAIADDQVLFRDMLRIILAQEPSFEVVGTAGDGAEMVSLCEKLHPNIALLDVKMPKYDGIYALLHIKEMNPMIRVIMLTTFEEENYIFKACSSKADGYVLKDTRPETLINTIKCVQDGMFVMHPSVQQHLFKLMEKEDVKQITSMVLEERYAFDQVDLSILRLLCTGRSNAEIATTINYSEGTVKNRISRMLETTSLKDRTQLAVFALQNSIV